jgi:hypothetical protein
LTPRQPAGAAWALPALRKAELTAVAPTPTTPAGAKALLLYLSVEVEDYRADAATIVESIVRCVEVPGAAA